jgi:hypothetical protein
MIGDEHIKSHITQYYKGLFGSPEVSGISLEESQISDIPQVSQEENEILTREFTESEVREARRCSRWNIIKHLAQKVFQWNSIKFSGK